MNEVETMGTRTERRTGTCSRWRAALSGAALTAVAVVSMVLGLTFPAAADDTEPQSADAQQAQSGGVSGSSLTQSDTGEGGNFAAGPTTRAGERPQLQFTFPPTSIVYGPIAGLSPESNSGGWDRPITVITGLVMESGRIVPTTTRLKVQDYTDEWINQHALKWQIHPAGKTKLLTHVDGFPDGLCLMPGSDRTPGLHASYLQSCDSESDWVGGWSIWAVQEHQCSHDPYNWDIQCYRWHLVTNGQPSCGFRLDNGRSGPYGVEGVLNSGRQVGISCDGDGMGGAPSNIVPIGVGKTPPTPAPVQTVEKQVSVEGSAWSSTAVASPNQVVTYKLRFTNSGSTPAPVSYVDDLRNVLTNAWNLSYSPSQGGLTLQAGSVANTLEITGNVPAASGATLGSVEVTYSVTVDTQAASDSKLVNQVVAGSTVPQTYPTENSCKISEKNCTVTTISNNASAITIEQRILNPGVALTGSETGPQLMNLSQPASGWDYYVETAPNLVLAGGASTQTTEGPGANFGTASWYFTGNGFARIHPAGKSGFASVPVQVDGNSMPAYCRTWLDQPAAYVNQSGQVYMPLEPGDINHCIYFAKAKPTLATVKEITGVERAGQLLAGVSEATPLTRGDKVTYTIFITNNGEAAGSTQLTETIPAGSTYANEPGEGWACNAGECTQTVSVPANSTQLVLFTVFIDDPLDASLREIVNAVETSVGSCDGCTVTNPIIGEWTLSKAVVEVERTGAAPVNGVVQPGDILTYNVIATGTQSAVYDLTLVDDLKRVLFDANDEPQADFVVGSARLEDGAGGYTPLPDPDSNSGLNAPLGHLNAGETLVLEYKIKIRDTAWSSNFKNVVSGAGPKGIELPAPDCGQNDQDCTVTVTTQHYFQVYKVAENNKAQVVGMPGTEWKLFTSETGTTEAVAVEQVNKPGGDPEPGLFSVSNVAAGTYWLQETAAPEGFELLAERVRIVVGSDGTIALSSTGAGQSDNITLIDNAPGLPGTMTIQIADTPRVELPDATGVGPWVVGTVIGTGLLFGAGILVVRRSVSPRNGSRHRS